MVPVVVHVGALVLRLVLYGVDLPLVGFQFVLPVPELYLIIGAVFRSIRLGNFLVVPCIGIIAAGGADAVIGIARFQRLIDTVAVFVRVGLLIAFQVRSLLGGLVEIFDEVLVILVRFYIALGYGDDGACADHILPVGGNGDHLGGGETEHLVDFFVRGAAVHHLHVVGPGRQLGGLGQISRRIVVKGRRPPVGKVHQARFAVQGGFADVPLWHLILVPCDGVDQIHLIGFPVGVVIGVDVRHAHGDNLVILIVGHLRRQGEGAALGHLPHGGDQDRRGAHHAHHGRQGRVPVHGVDQFGGGGILLIVDLPHGVLDLGAGHFRVVGADGGPGPGCGDDVVLECGHIPGAEHPDMGASRGIDLLFPFLDLLRGHFLCGGGDSIVGPRWDRFSVAVQNHFPVFRLGEAQVVAQVEVAGDGAVVHLRVHRHLHLYRHRKHAVVFQILPIRRRQQVVHRRREGHIERLILLDDLPQSVQDLILEGIPVGEGLVIPEIGHRAVRRAVVVGIHGEVQVRVHFHLILGVGQVVPVAHHHPVHQIQAVRKVVVAIGKDVGGQRVVIAPGVPHEVERLQVIVVDVVLGDLLPVHHRALLQIPDQRALRGLGVGADGAVLIGGAVVDADHGVQQHPAAQTHFGPGLVVHRIAEHHHTGQGGVRLFRVAEHRQLLGDVHALHGPGGGDHLCSGVIADMKLGAAHGGAYLL